MIELYSAPANTRVSYQYNVHAPICHFVSSILRWCPVQQRLQFLCQVTCVVTRDTAFIRRVTRVAYILSRISVWRILLYISLVRARNNHRFGWLVSRAPSGGCATMDVSVSCPDAACFIWFWTYVWTSYVSAKDVFFFMARGHAFTNATRDIRQTLVLCRNG